MFGNFRESIYFICIIRSVDMEQYQKVFAVYAPARYTVTRPDRQSSSHSIEIAANMWQPRALHTHTIFQVTSTTARCLTLHSGVQFLVRNAFSPH